MRFCVDAALKLFYSLQLMREIWEVGWNEFVYLIVI